MPLFQEVLHLVCKCEHQNIPTKSILSLSVQAVVHPMDPNKPTESLDLSKTSAAETLSTYVHQKGDRVQAFQYKRVEIFWPFSLLKVSVSLSLYLSLSFMDVVKVTSLSLSTGLVLIVLRGRVPVSCEHYRQPLPKVC